MERLDKFLCDSTGFTRSQIKPILKAGRVSVDGKPEKDGSRKIDPGLTVVCLDGQPCNLQQRVVLMLNKPAGYVTATEDAVEKTVMELIPQPYRQKVKPVGRLDKETVGLLLFTDDGELLHRLISPKRQIPKVYYARHEGTATAEDVQSFSRGLMLADGTQCLPATLTPAGENESLITVCEGKYHQVRRMMASRNLPVTYLQRRQEGALTLGTLPEGQVRVLEPEEVEMLLQSVNML